MIISKLFNLFWRTGKLSPSGGEFAKEKREAMERRWFTWSLVTLLILLMLVMKLLRFSAFLILLLVLVIGGGWVISRLWGKRK